MSAQRDPGAYYQILIQERLGERWAEWFEGMNISHNEQGFTVLTGLIADQSALQGILSTIGILNMTLISVAQSDVISNKDPQTDQDENASSD